MKSIKTILGDPCETVTVERTMHARDAARPIADPCAACHVLDQGRLAGIVSLRDLLAVGINEKDEAIGLLNACVYSIPADVDIRLKA